MSGSLPSSKFCFFYKLLGGSIFVARVNTLRQSSLFAEEFRFSSILYWKPKNERRWSNVSFLKQISVWGKESIKSRNLVILAYNMNIPYVEAYNLLPTGHVLFRTLYLYQTLSGSLATCSAVAQRHVICCLFVFVFVCLVAIAVTVSCSVSQIVLFLSCMKAHETTCLNRSPHLGSTICITSIHSTYK
jgi:hypothetical protein